MKLDIGVRKPGSDGWTTVDIYPGADLLSPMWNLHTVGAPVTEIRAIHVLEHAPFGMVLATLQEWHRVLVPGGHVTIEVPDLEGCLALLASDPLTALFGIFGNQADDGMLHRWGFTSVILSDLMTEAGFELPNLESTRTFGFPTIRAEALRG